MSEPGSDLLQDDFDHEELRAFWNIARFHARMNAAPSYFGPTPLESVPPPAWSFGESAHQSDEFVDTVLAAEGGETSAPVAEYGDELPQSGVLSILCDGSGVPRALIEVTDVTVGDGEVVEAFQVVYRA